MNEILRTAATLLVIGINRLRSLVPKKLMLRQEVSRFDRDEKKIIFVGSFYDEDRQSSSGEELAVCIYF